MLNGSNGLLETKNEKNPEDSEDSFEVLPQDPDEADYILVHEAEACPVDLNKPRDVYVRAYFYEQRQHKKQAVKLYHEAANKGDVYAQYELGRRYENEIGVPKDWQKAEEFYSKAAKQGHKDAINRLALVKRDREEFEPLINNAQSIEELYRLGHYYTRGVPLVLPKDEAKAADCFQRAMAKGSLRAAYELGCLYEEGRGVVKDEEKAIKLFQSVTHGYSKNEAAERLDLLLTKIGIRLATTSEAAPTEVVQEQQPPSIVLKI